VALNILGLLLVPIYAVQAQPNGETVYVNLNIAPDPVNVNADDYIVLRHGWMACTRDLVQAYLSAMYAEVYINDVLISAMDGKNKYWAPITHYEGNLVQYRIAGNQRTASFVDWQYPLGTLTPGEYEVHFYYQLDHPVVDGADLDGDGRMDKREGLLNDRTFTIIVLE
jgi:hypothetical protein